MKFSSQFEQEMAQIFNRRDIIGKISRFILEPPEEIKVNISLLFGNADVER